MKILERKKSKRKKGKKDTNKQKEEVLYENSEMQKKKRI